MWQNNDSYFVPFENRKIFNGFDNGNAILKKNDPRKTIWEKLQDASNLRPFSQSCSRVSVLFLLIDCCLRRAYNMENNGNLGGLSQDKSGFDL